jgi:hypothetical protein
MTPDTNKTNEILGAAINEAEQIITRLHDLNRQMGATAVEQLTAMERYDLRVAAAGLVRVGKAMEGIAYIKPEPKEIKAPPDAELYDRLLGPEFRPSGPCGYNGKPIVITIENDTTIFVEGRLIEFSREQVFIFNKLFLSRLGVPTRVFASALQHESEGTPAARVRVRNMLKGFVFLLGDNIVSQSRLQGRPFGFNADVEFTDIREAAGLKPPAQEVPPPPPPEPEPAEIPLLLPPPAPPRPARALTKKSVPPAPKPEVPEPIVVVPSLPSSEPELTPGGNGNSRDPDITKIEVEAPPLYETQTLAVVKATEGLLKKGWRDADDIAQELGIDVAIVNRFVERNRPKLGKEFAESQKLRRPGQARYTTRMTEHFSPKFSAWAIASIRQAKAKFEASRDYTR